LASHTIASGVAAALALAAYATPAQTGNGQDSNWPGFRGANAAGIAEGYETPSQWSVSDSLDATPGPSAPSRVVWRAPIAGLAHSSPVIWGQRVFVTSAVRVRGESDLSSLYGSQGYGSGDPVEDEGEHDFRLTCLDKRSGRTLWERSAYVGPPKVKRHPKSTHANSTPACDAQRVLAFFGSEGLYCYDHSGELLWKKDLGVLDAGAPGMPQYQWGFASSPIITEHGRNSAGEPAAVAVVQCDVQGQSFLAALDMQNGEEVWRVDRDEDPTWSTPAIAISPGRTQVVVNGYKHIGGYDLLDGKQLWKLVGGGDVPVPTPLVAGDLIYITSAHGRLRPIYAVRSDAEGLLDMDPEKCEHMAWSYARRGIYMQTPIVYGGLMYACSDGGALACYDALSGEEQYRERLGSGSAGFSGSAVAADGKLYFSAEDGEVFVVQAGPEFRLLSVNPLGETHLATPAVSEGRLFFRTRGHVVCVGEPWKVAK